MFTRAIVRPPAANFSEGLTTAGLGAPDYEAALRQHEAYCKALEQCGLTLTRLPADPKYPDSTFVEDVAVLVGAAGPPVAILTRPGAVSRRDEVASVRRALEDFFPGSSMLAIESPGTVDGGDICEAGDHFFIGISERTNESGAHQLVRFLETLGYGASLVDIRSNSERTVPDILHLKSALAHVGENCLAVTETLAGRAKFRDYELITVGRDEEYAANCVRINDYVLVAAGYPVFQSRLRDLGYQTISLEMSEFQKMDGGLSCLSLRF